jgi:hypothetical protein
VTEAEDSSPGERGERGRDGGGSGEVVGARSKIHCLTCCCYVKSNNCFSPFGPCI